MVLNLCVNLLVTPIRLLIGESLTLSLATYSEPCAPVEIRQRRGRGSARFVPAQWTVHHALTKSTFCFHDSWLSGAFEANFLVLSSMYFTRYREYGVTPEQKDGVRNIIKVLQAVDLWTATDEKH